MRNEQSDITYSSRLLSLSSRNSIELEIVWIFGYSYAGITVITKRFVCQNEETDVHS